MVDALTQNDDERRSVAAIRFGEVPNNRYIRRFLNGETPRACTRPYELHTEYTRGSKTFQYPEENRTIVIA